jgi:hypothetical protein
VDRTHIFSGSLILALPTFEGKSSFVKNVFGDWEFTSIVQAGTGYPVTIIASAPGINGGLNGAGNNSNRPNRVESEACTVSSSNKTQWINPAAFTLNGYQLGTTGTAGRHICDGPSIFQADASIYKNIKLGPRVKLQLRAEMYNVFNTVNFKGDSLNLSYDAQNVVYDTGNASTATRIVSATAPGNFGQLNSARDPRTMQLGLRLTF